MSMPNAERNFFCDLNPAASESSEERATRQRLFFNKAGVVGSEVRANGYRSMIGSSASLPEQRYVFPPKTVGGHSRQ